MPLIKVLLLAYAQLRVFGILLASRPFVYGKIAVRVCLPLAWDRVRAIVSTLPLQYVSSVVSLPTIAANVSVIPMVLNIISIKCMLEMVSSTYAPFVTSQIRWSSEVLVAAEFSAWNSWLVVVMHSFVLVPVRLFRELVLTNSALEESALLASSFQLRRVFALVRVPRDMHAIGWLL